MKQILLFIFLVLFVFNARSQSSSLDSLRMVYPSVEFGFFGIEGNGVDLFATYGGSEKVEIYLLPEYKMIRSYSLPCDITVDVLFDNEKLYVLGYSYQADSLNYVIGLFDAKTQKNEITTRFSSASSSNWSFNDLTWDTNKNIRIECLDSIYYYTRDLTSIRKESNPTLDSDNNKSPKFNYINSWDDDFVKIHQFNQSINDFLNYEVEKTERPFTCQYSILPLFSDTIICTSEAQIISTRNGNVKNKTTLYDGQFDPIQTKVNSFDESLNSKLVRLNQLYISDKEYDLSRFNQNFTVFYIRDNTILFKTDKAISDALLKKYDLPFEARKLKKNRLYFFNSEWGLTELEKVHRFYDITNYRFINDTIYTLSIDGDLNIYSIGEREISAEYFDVWEHFESNDPYHTLDLEIDTKHGLLQITTNIGLLLELDLYTLAPVDTISTTEMWSQRIANLNEDMYALESNGYNFYVRDRATDQNKLKLVYLDNKNTIITLPNSPYYMCSKGASKMLHYVTPSLKVIGFDQLDPVYNRPDIVLDSIGKYFGRADQELVARYREAWEKRIDRLGLDKGKLGKGEISVPNVEFVGAEDIAYENTSGQIELKVEANDPKYILRRFNILVNEVPLYGAEDISIASRGLMDWDTTISVPLGVGENKIQVSVMNELGLENFKYPTYVNYTPENEEMIVSKTYFIGIGVDNFEDDQIADLDYCVKDITDLSKAFQSNSQTQSVVLTNEEVTKENILALKNTLMNTSVHDKVIISCSSHGLLDDQNRFYLAMYDIDANHPEDRGLPYEDLEALLDSIPARQKLLMLDACNSGENEIEEAQEGEMELAQNTAETNTAEGGRNIITLKSKSSRKSSFDTMMELFVNVSNETGAVVISAAGGKQSALEGQAVEVDGKPIKNGAFTHSVLEYLKKTDERLTVNGLKSYVENRVQEITNGKQRPTSRQETMEVDWDLR